MMNDPPPRSARCGMRHVRQPEIAAHIGTHDAFVNLVRHAGGRAEIRIDRGIAHHDVDPAAASDRLVHQVLQFLLARDVAGDHRRPRRRVSRIPAATASHASALRLDTTTFAPCSAIRVGDGAADAFAGTGNDRDLAGQIEQRRHSGFPPCACREDTAPLGLTRPRRLPWLPVSMLPVSGTSIRRGNADAGAPPSIAGNSSAGCCIRKASR